MRRAVHLRTKRRPQNFVDCPLWKDDRHRHLAIRNPEVVDRLVFFAPIARRELRQGKLAYDPVYVRAPLAIVRGEWDSMCTDADARWLFDALSGSPTKRDVKIN